MKKFKFLIKYGLAKRMKRKSFLIANIVIFLFTIILVNIPQIIDAFSSNETIEHINVEVLNQTGDDFVDDLSNFFNAPYGSEFFIFNEISQFDEVAFWNNQDVDVIFVFDGTIAQTSVNIYSKYTDMNTSFESAISLFLIDYQIPGYTGPLYTFNYAPDYEDPAQSETVNALSSLLVLPIFILIIMATAFVGVEIIEEKSTKAIETIIASVPAKIHFLSKVTSAILFVISQALLVFLYGLIAGLFSNTITSTNASISTISLLRMLGEMIPNWPLILMFVGLFTFVGAIFYLVIAAMFASMAVTQEDYQQFQAPLMMVLLAAYYISIFGSIAGGGSFLMIMSFIPIFTPIVAPIAYAIGSINLIQTIIALIVSIGFMILSLYLVAPIYKVAILSYDQTKFGKRIKGYFKKAFNK